MRILMLTELYPPAMGGIEIHVHTLSIELVSRGHEVAVATLWQAGQPELEIDQGVRIYRIRALMQRATFLYSEQGRTYSPPIPDPEVLWSLRHIILHERPDIVHAHNWMVHSFIPLKAWSKAKLVMTLHDFSFLCATRQFLHEGTICKGPALGKCLKCAANHYGVAKGIPTLLANAISARAERNMVDIFIPVNRAVAKEVQMVWHGVRYCVIPNFVPNDLDMSCDHSNPLLAQLPQGNFLLFVGHISRVKGAEVLLQAYAGMESQIPLVLIGRPVLDFSVDLPPNVLMLQSWPHAAVMSAWSRCMIALIPSTCPETGPIVAIEAMTFGKPIAASSVGGLPDIVKDGETGLLVPPGDAHALSKAIQSLLADPARREHMGTMAKQRASKFQVREVVPRIEQAYQQVLYS
jgi:glycosyltransferase involved in cell wall biosynthesis